jgi:hypothetical protein
MFWLVLVVDWSKYGEASGSRDHQLSLCELCRKRISQVWKIRLPFHLTMLVRSGFNESPQAPPSCSDQQPRPGLMKRGPARLMLKEPVILLFILKSRSGLRELALQMTIMTRLEAPI